MPLKAEAGRKREKKRQIQNCESNCWPMRQLCHLSFPRKNETFKVSRNHALIMQKHATTPFLFCCYRPADTNKNVMMADAKVELPYKTARTPVKSAAASAASAGQTGSEPSAAGTGSSGLTSPSPLGMDKSTLKVHLPNGSFNVVRFGDATDIKVCVKVKFDHH